MKFSVNWHFISLFSPMGAVLKWKVEISKQLSSENSLLMKYEHEHPGLPLSQFRMICI